MRVLAILFFIMFQWWVNLILLLADTIVSYAIAVWYFEKKKETVVVRILLYLVIKSISWILLNSRKSFLRNILELLLCLLFIKLSLKLRDPYWEE